jgi:hypothetical protein
MPRMLRHVHLETSAESIKPQANQATPLSMQAAFDKAAAVTDTAYAPHFVSMAVIVFSLYLGDKLDILPLQSWLAYSGLYCWHWVRLRKPPESRDAAALRRAAREKRRRYALAAAALAARKSEDSPDFAAGSSRSLGPERTWEVLSMSPQGHRPSAPSRSQQRPSGRAVDHKSYYLNAEQQSQLRRTCTGGDEGEADSSVCTVNSRQACQHLVFEPSALGGLRSRRSHAQSQVE